MGILSMVGGFNPYVAIAGGVAVAAVIGGFVYDDHMIHHYHTQYDQTVLADAKTITGLQFQIKSMTDAQKDQSTKTAPIITSVIRIPPETITIVKTIHDAPLPADCTTPALDTLRNNT